MFIHTPIENYKILDRDIFVKREALCIPSNQAPALAKLRGVYFRLIKLKKEGIKLIGVTDTRISKSGWGVAYLLNEVKGMKLINFFPLLKDQTQSNESQKMVVSLGYDVCGLKAGRTAVVYSNAKKMLAGYINAYMLPLGLVVEESVSAIMEEAMLIEDKYLGGDIVVSVGSGMTILGISLAVSSKVNKIYGISAGMSTDRQMERIKNISEAINAPELPGISGLQIKPSASSLSYLSKFRLNVCDLPKNVQLILPAGVEYYQEENIETPFPCSIYYDKKAWRWMVDNIEILKSPILFWNIGV